MLSSLEFFGGEATHAESGNEENTNVIELLDLLPAHTLGPNGY
jgi:hypothetical protein